MCIADRSPSGTPTSVQEGVTCHEDLRSIRIRDIHIRNLICNINKQEQLSYELVGHFRYARGINKEFLIFCMAILHHHSIKPYGKMGNRTSAEAIGIGIWGADRWLTLIQNSAAAA